MFLASQVWWVCVFEQLFRQVRHSVNQGNIQKIFKAAEWPGKIA